MKGNSLRKGYALCALLAVTCGLAALWARPASFDPPFSQSFAQSTSGWKPIAQYDFGSGAHKNVGNLKTLAGAFSPFGIAGHKVVNGEWDIYQPFNEVNFVFTPAALNLTATIPAGGGLFPGGIHSAQITTKQTFQPGVTGRSAYAFEVRMKIPAGRGMWPAAWFYAQQPGLNDGSEIDNPEFYIMRWQNEYDWTGFQHGPGQGAELYSIKNNRYTWHPGINFAADYHNYQTLWTGDAVFKYVDGKLIFGQRFRWTSAGAAQLLVTLAVGGEAGKLPGLEPNSLSEFPAVLAVDHISIWAR